jgi:hypothetical protein
MQDNLGNLFVLVMFIAMFYALAQTLFALWGQLG